MKRSGRKAVAWLSLLTLLFLQISVAAYACAGVSTADASLAPIASTAAAADGPCHEIDASLPKLCEQHCLRASHSVDTQPQPALGAPVLSLVIVMAPIDLYVPGRRSTCAAYPTAVDPPPLVRFGVLRI